MGVARPPFPPEYGERRLRTTCNCCGQWIDEAGDDFFGGQLVGGVEKNGEHFVGRDAVGQAPITADGEQDADRRAREVIAPHLVGRRPRLHLDIGLHVAVVIEGNSEARLGVEHVMGLVGVEEFAGQMLAEEGVGDELVVVAAVAEVEAVDDLQMIVDQVAEGQIIWGLGEDQRAERANIFEIGWGDVAELDVVGFEAEPAAGAVVVGLILEREGAAVAPPELFEAGVVLADAVEKVKNRLVVEAHVEFQEEAAVDVELVALCAKAVGHEIPRSSTGPGEASALVSLIMGYAKGDFNREEVR